MRLELKKVLLFLFCSLFLFSFSSFGQTISLSDFANEVKKDKVDKELKKVDKLADLKLLRDNQIGLSIHLFGSIIGSSSLEPTIDYFNASPNEWFDWRDGNVKKWKNNDFLKGYDLRIVYSKESFIPFGIYGGFGSASLFLGRFNEEIDTNTYIITPSKSNYFVIGLSKNINLSSTIYLGYVQFDNVERTDLLQTTNLQESIGFNLGYTYSLNRFAISIDNIFHLPFYEESVYLEGNKINQDFIYGHRVQIGIGYIF